MYTPPYFAMNDAARIAEFLRANSFGVLISFADGELCATHLPFLYDAEQNALFAHMARANPAWRDLEGQSALAVFSGPHAYVSPSWYGEPESVPTWNYAAVHVSGTCSLLEDGGQLAALLHRTVRFYEPGSALLSQADEPFYRGMMKGIVGFRIDIARIEGKAKLSQNKSEVVRGRVLEHLAKSDDAGAQGVARLMREEAE